MYYYCLRFEVIFTIIAMDQNDQEYPQNLLHFGNFPASGASSVCILKQALAFYSRVMGCVCRAFRFPLYIVLPAHKALVSQPVPRPTAWAKCVTSFWYVLPGLVEYPYHFQHLGDFYESQ